MRLEQVAARRRAVRLSGLGGVDFLELLAGGKAWQRLQQNRSRPILAVVRGRQEHQPTPKEPKEEESIKILRCNEILITLNYS